MNTLRLVADQAESTDVMLSVASGSLSEVELADWIRRNMKAA
jgi:prophage maintenance system killer protein